MNARRDSSSEPPRGSFGGRLLLTAAGLLVCGATAALVLTDQQQWLRLGIVAALWAALAGAFLAARYRRQVSDQEDVLAERHEKYQLELEREIAARREYELEVAAEARRQADEEARDDIASLRQELFGLRQTLESLLGGEFLVERYALRAESTRMRSLPDDLELKRLPPAASVVQDAQTDLIESIGKQSKSPNRKVEPLPRRAAGGRTQVPRPNKPPVVDAPPEPAHQAHPAELSDRWFVPDGLGTNQPPKPADAQPYGARRYAQPDRRAAVASGYVEPVGGPRADANGFGPGTSGYLTPAEPTAFGTNGNAAAGGHAESSGYGLPVRRAEPSGYRQGVGHAESSGYGPAINRTESGFGSGRAESSGYGPAVNGAEPHGFGHGAGRAEASGYGQAVNGAGPSGYGHGDNGAGPSSFGLGAGPAESSGYGSAVGHGDLSGFGPGPGRADASGYRPAVGRAETSGYGPAINRAQPPSFGPGPGRAEASGYGPAVGSNGTPNPAESSGYGPAAPPPDTGGRRRRAEGQPTWQETRDAGGQPQPGAEPSGSHAAGRSVSELLASHGGGRPSTPRRRRRKE